MRAFIKSIHIESVLFIRGFFGFFFTFFFPIIMLFLFGAIYGNEPSAFYGGYRAMDMAVPSYIAMIIGVNGLMSFPLALAEYKESNVYKRFDATPAGKGIIIGAQISINIAMTILGITLLVLIGKCVYGIQINGNFFIIAVSATLSIFSIFTLGFFITAIARDVKITNLLCYLLYFIMLFTSGATVPTELFPNSMQGFSSVLPLTHACAETFFHSMKVEWFYGNPLLSRYFTKKAILEYIEVFYNRNRLHSTIGYLSPCRFDALSQISKFSVSA